MSNLVLESQRTPRDLLVFYLLFNVKEIILILAKECLSNRIDDLARENENKQAKSKCPSSMWLSVGCRKHSLDLG